MAYGWGTPLVIVGICAAIEFGSTGMRFGYTPDQHQIKACWISNPLANLLAFGVPLAVLLVMNATLFTLSLMAISQVAKETQKAKSEIRKSCDSDAASQSSQRKK